MTNLQPHRDVLIAKATEQGFQHAASLIHVFAGGSDQHGAKDPNKESDLDVCGVYIEPSRLCLGLDKEEHFIASTGDDTSRNTSADKDIALYTLRKWAFLAAKGNPTVLSYLFMPIVFGPAGIWTEVAVNYRLFIAKDHVEAFIGFGRSQYGRINGKRGKGKHGQRDEIIHVHGYDTKAAMHMIRMMYDVITLLDTGWMTFPNPKYVGDLVDIRMGKYTLPQVNEMYLELERVAYVAARQSRLPQSIDRSAISKLVADLYAEHYCKEAA